MATALTTLMSMPRVTLAPEVSPLHEIPRFARALGRQAPRVFIKRDDLLSFGLGGNKVRKMQTVIAEAQAASADTLITCGGLQSNHARVTAATGAALGLRVVLVLNGTPDGPPTANTRLDQLFGADVRVVSSRAERDKTMQAVAREETARGRRPFIVPVGASTAIGALGFAHGLGELAGSDLRPDVIVHASSSGGTQAGMVAGCALFGLRPRILGVSADEPAVALQAIVRRLLAAVAPVLAAKPASLGADGPIEIDDTQVGDGYGIPTAASTEALELVARHEGILLDPVYTAKAMAALIGRVRTGEWHAEHTILFWHTGGQIGFFA